MAVKTFAAIDVGSFEISMKIFQVSRKGMKEIDHIRHEIDMGTETYTTGKLSYERVEELCRVLCEFSEIMKTYQVCDYKAYGTSAIREAENTAILLNQIEVRTGIHIDVLSNSEQRFLDYKSIAFQGEGFLKIIENGTAIVDIGGGSIQISLFDKDTLVSTQNMRLGVLRLQERLNHLNASLNQYDNLIEEEIRYENRVIYNDDDFLIFIPEVCRFNGDTVILFKDNTYFSDIEESKLKILSAIMSKLFRKLYSEYGNCPFNLYLHTHPVNEKNDYKNKYNVHIHIVPRKFNFGGFELSTGVYISSESSEDIAKRLKFD